MTLVNMPGFWDTIWVNARILSGLASWIKQLSNDDKLLRGIIFMYSISSNCNSHGSPHSVRIMEQLCGKDNLGKVVLATTDWDTTPALDAVRRENDLTSPEGFWHSTIKAGSSIHRYKGSIEGAEGLLTHLLDIGPLNFQLMFQGELDNGTDLYDTTAMTYVKEAWREKYVKFLTTELDRVRKPREEPCFFLFLQSTSLISVQKITGRIKPSAKSFSD